MSDPNQPPNSGDDSESGPLGDFAEGVSPLGKYLLLEVPNFNSYDGGTPMTSYLRLGAVRDPTIVASPNAPKASGEDLAAYITDFIDDTRVREGCPGYVPPGERQAETARLHTKGGWRDHSDGNRISTTRGDKVEVVRGNYRMVVLGRRDDTLYKAGWDISGGHVAESGITFQGQTTIEWAQTYGGTWRVTENTVKGDVFTTYHGDTHDNYFGLIKESNTGSAAPGDLKENPIITDRTFAQSISSYTGSSALPVPSISDQTWAVAIESVTNADTISEETNVTTLSSKTSATAMSDDVTATTITSSTVADVMTSSTVANAFNSHVGIVVNSFVGSETEIVVGNMNELTIGNQNSLTVGALIELTIGLIVDICIAGKVEVALGATWEFDGTAKFEIAPAKASVCSDKTEAAVKSIKAAAAHLIF